MTEFEILPPDELERRLTGRRFSLDVETMPLPEYAHLSKAGLRWYQNKVIGVGLSCKAQGVRAYLPIMHENTKRVSAFLWRLVEHPQTEVIAHNTKFDTHCLGLDPNDSRFQAQIHDTSLMIHLLDSREKKALEIAEQRWLGTNRKAMHLKPHRNKRNKVHEWPLSQVADYCTDDAIITEELFAVLAPKIGKAKLLGLYIKELRFLRLLWAIERRGVRIDLEALESQAAELARRQEELERDLYERCGYTFNWRATKQLSKALYDDLGISKPRDPNPGHRHTMSKYYTEAATSSKLLVEKVKHPVGGIVLALREAAKLRTTLVGGSKDALGWRDLADDEPALHTSFNQTNSSPDAMSGGTRTGRLCVSRDTLIEMPRDLTKYPEGVPITQLKAGDWVYSYTWDMRLCLRRVKWVGPTGIKQTIRLCLIDREDRLSEIRLTPEHLVRMFRGEWEPAGRLEAGNRLLAMIRRGLDTQNKQTYAYFFPTAFRRSSESKGKEHWSGRAKEHRWIVAQMMDRDRLPTKWDVHHKDGNGLNNSTENLELINHSSHMKMHRPYIFDDDTLLAMIRGEQPMQRDKRVIRRMARKRNLLSPANHHVVAVEIGEMEEVWDVEIEDTHTFIGNGIVLHNSSTAPNLQNLTNVTRRSQASAAYGEEGITRTGAYLLRNVIVARPGYTFVAVDSSQQEARLLALLSGEERMIALLKTKSDIYADMAEMIWGTRDPIHRRWAKDTTLAINYGMNEASLAEYLSLPRPQAHDIHQRYFATFPRIPAYLREVAQTAKQHGAVRTWEGRLWRPANNSEVYKAVNAEIQGGAAGLVSVACLRIARWLVEHDAGFIVLLVHDEALLEVEDDRVPEVAPVVAMLFEVEDIFGVPFPSTIATGRRFGEMTKWDAN